MKYNMSKNRICTIYLHSSTMLWRINKCIVAARTIGIGFSALFSPKVLDLRTIWEKRLIGKIPYDTYNTKISKRRRIKVTIRRKAFHA